MQNVKEMGAQLLEGLETLIHGKTEALRQALICLLAEGHLLIEDVPGTAKTLMAKALARLVGGDFRRIQGTADLLPGDVTGSSVYNPKTGEFRFIPGPVFCNVLLADEINRATPRAQAALLECMAERQVSVEGLTYRLPRPFFTVATQNPVEHEGTFPLPEAQLDRFLMRIAIGYPSFEAEQAMLTGGDVQALLSQLTPQMTPDQLVALQEQITHVHVKQPVRTYIIRMVSATRFGKEFILGAGPRATRGLYRAAQARAALDGRDYVLPDDVKALYPAVLYHRVILSPEGRLSGRTVKRAVDDVVSRVSAPVDGGQRATVSKSSGDPMDLDPNSLPKLRFDG